jgi:hypothetical protein
MESVCSCETSIGLNGVILLFFNINILLNDQGLSFCKVRTEFVIIILLNRVFQRLRDSLVLVGLKTECDQSGSAFVHKVSGIEVMHERVIDHAK